MKNSLIIVESPTKAKTIGAFLDKNYKILSSYGHVRDLPKSSLGIEPENDFKIKYVIPTKARKNVNLLKKEVEKADMVYIATDPDREGEAIAWHLIELLKLGKDKDYQRISFHEITPQAINNALKKPSTLDINLVNAQQARRALDRIVGYKLSPLLWKKIARHLSAGRVQSVALKLIVDREREIQKFIPEEYWTITGLFEKNNNKVETLLSKIKNKKPLIKNEKEAKEIMDSLKNKEYTLSKLEKKTTKRNPLPPFTTSTLQQEASKKIRFPSSLTMKVAQELYEKGYITYHRTDSLNLSTQSISTAKNFIIKQFGKEYAVESGRKFKTKKRAQEAHEAIRPTNIENTPNKLKLDEKQKKLYNLIWTRFTACQMKEALFNSVKIEISSKEKDCFEASGLQLKFDGFLKVYNMKIEEKEIPQFNEKDSMNLFELKPFQHFTKPPARFNEASLIKELENNEIGRPSTYAPTISTIQKRNYVLKNDDKRFEPTETGFSVNDLLAEHFPEIVDIKFTAKMENDLDDIAQGKDWIKLLKEFYNPFNEKLEKKYNEIAKKPIEQKLANKNCPKCGKPMLIKRSRFGEFMACPGFPECRYTESIEDKNTKTGIVCPKCEQGEIIAKRTKKGKIFYGCSQWPECDFASWYKPTGERCPKCNSLLIEKGKKIVCENKNCDFIKK
ncbi:MAG: type I DNA topoisomerase [Candidatus Pacebacteria bacterium]|jgi:DNA topoisomerase-1|nr:type I DNA topoisomerase [Candidatus Paceibacterota bacterium]MDD5012777.1 type I DNA topoisomerase [Candidatus Paceibacterota bacterium]MDD5752827.1 type I DNA topoisomerase [Candidatus Paceibacterota bacterium]